MTEDRLFDREQGSIIVVLGTDLPMAPHQLRRLAKRAAIGIGRGGTPGGNNSGDIFLAFSTANRGPLPQLSGLTRTLETSTTRPSTRSIWRRPRLSRRPSSTPCLPPRI